MHKIVASKIYNKLEKQFRKEVGRIFISYLIAR